MGCSYKAPTRPLGVTTTQPSSTNSSPSPAPQFAGHSSTSLRPPPPPSTHAGPKMRVSGIHANPCLAYATVLIRSAPRTGRLTLTRPTSFMCPSMRAATHGRCMGSQISRPTPAQRTCACRARRTCCCWQSGTSRYCALWAGRRNMGSLCVCVCVCGALCERGAPKADIGKSSYVGNLVDVDNPVDRIELQVE
eukprot:366543-Chlamydomonas_euryale.AAC.4